MNNQLIKFYFQINNPLQTPVNIFNMGKVGSSSLHSALIKNHRFRFVAHTHDFLTNSNNYRQNFYFNHRPHKEIVLSPYRDPLSHNISWFFENLDIRSVNKYKGKLNLEKLTFKFYEFYASKNIALDFYYKNFRDMYGLSFNQATFDQIENGVFQHFHDGKRFIIYPYNLSEMKKFKLLKMIGLKYSPNTRSNVSDQKWYSNIMNDFKKIKLDNNYLETLYQSKYYKDFFISNG